MDKRLSRLLYLVFLLSLLQISSIQITYAQSGSWYFSWACINSGCTSVMRSSSGREGPYTQQQCVSNMNAMSSAGGIRITQSCSSSGSPVSVPSTSSLPFEQQIATDMAMGIIGGFLEGLLTGPSPQQIEANRRAALAEQQRLIEEQRRIEEERLRVQQNLIAGLIPLSETSISTLGASSNNLEDMLINFDGASPLTGQSTLDLIGNDSPSDLSLSLIDLSSATSDVPVIPEMFDPVEPGLLIEESLMEYINSLPPGLIEDPEFLRLEAELKARNQIREDYLQQKREMDERLASGEITLEEWNQFQAIYQQDLANLDLLIERSEYDMRELAQEYGMQPWQYEAELVAEFFNSTQNNSSPIDSTLLVFETPEVANRPEVLTTINENDLAQQQGFVDLLNDPEYLETRSIAYTLRTMKENLENRMESSRVQYENGQLSQMEWDAFNSDYQNDIGIYDTAIDANLRNLRAVYDRHDVAPSSFVEEFYFLEN